MFKIVLKGDLETAEVDGFRRKRGLCVCVCVCVCVCGVCVCEGGAHSHIQAQPNIVVGSWDY